MEIRIQERKINLITEGLEPRYAKALENISKENALAIVEFILNTITEINLSDNHKRNYISLLSQLSKFYDHKYHQKDFDRRLTKQQKQKLLEHHGKSLMVVN